MRIKETIERQNYVKSLKYKIEPGGEEICGDPSCSFLAVLPFDELTGGQGISAYIGLEDGGNEIRKEVNIPLPYNPQDYDLSADYSNP